jgi:hypothetical protein
VTQAIDPQLEVRDLAPDLWIWRVLHPGWTEWADWQPIVTGTCVDLGRERLLLDPLVPPPDANAFCYRLDAAPTAVVTLLPDHVRPICDPSQYHVLQVAVTYSGRPVGR